MVLPLILPLLAGAAGAAASGIGSMIQGQEAAANEEAAIRARNQAVRHELRRQGKFTRQAADVFTDSLGIFKPDAIQRRMAGADATTTGAVVGNIPTGDFGSIGSMVAPAAMQAEGQQFAAAGAGRGQQFGDSLGQLLSHDQWLTENARLLADKQRRLNRISDFSQGSARVNQIEQAVAGKNSQEQPSIWGPLLQAAGTVGSYVAGKGGF